MPVPENNYLVSLVRGETEALREIMPKFEQSLQKLEGTFPNVIQEEWNLRQALLTIVREKKEKNK